MRSNLIFSRREKVAGAALGLLLLVARSLVAQDRAIPFWPDEVPAAIHAEVDGVAALETVRELGRFHRVHGSPGFAAAAEHMKQKLLAAGLTDASIERFPADGKERGAAGFLSDFPNQATAWTGDDRDLVRWGHLDPYETSNRFAFMLSRRQAEELRARLAGGEKLVLHARVRAKMVPATYDVVVATIPGMDSSAGEVVLTAHLCHESAGANDNASGSAAILEVARALRAAIHKQTLMRPPRTIRFLWLPEIAGSQAYLVRHPEVAKRLAAGIHMDMVGGLLATTKGTFHLSRTAETLPHAANAIARAWFEQIVAASAHYAERGGDSYAGFAWPSGSREVFLGDIRPLEMGSDHEVFEESSFAVPMVYFHDWPDVTIHTNKDQPENLDATKLGRVAYMGAGIAWTLAALPEAEAPRLLAATLADAEERIVRANAASGAEAPLVRREAAAAGIETLQSVARLWPSTEPAVAAATERMRRLLPAPGDRKPADGRIPVRNPAIRGPLDVYYYSYLGDAAIDVTAPHLDSDILRFEAFNLVDGKRSVSEVRDILAGRYGAAPLPEVAAYFDMLAKAGAVRFSP